ncbi:MAG: hypothetical protein PF572_06710 [Patescibacteria group bacterium]|jgi:hypothetical protein|nr:hypothetical protein [Patescibacteria group bacterium]
MENIETTEVKTNKSNVLLYVIVALLLISNVVAFYFLFSGLNKNSVVENVNTNLDSDEVVQDNNVVDEIQDEVATSSEDIEEVNSDDDKLVLKGDEITVTWNKWPVVSTFYDLFDYNKIYGLLETHNNKSENKYNPIAIEEFSRIHTIYKVGVIDNGPYSGKDLFIVTYRPEGPVHRDSMSRVVKDEGRLVLLANYSDAPWGIYEDLYVKDSGTKILNYSSPEKIQIPDSDIFLIKREEEPFLLKMNVDNPKEMFSYEGGVVYRDTQADCFFTEEGDGTIRYYNIDSATAKLDKTSGDIAPSVPAVLDIVWKNGEKNIDEYISKAGGCSFGTCYNYVDYVGIDDLALIGEGPSGKYYYLKDIAFTMEGRDKSLLQEMYDMYYVPEQSEKLSYEDFLTKKPIIYWQDPFGDFIEYSNAAFIPMAECGKPVIYLYPEQEMNVSVWVEPSGGFTVTEPAYNNGWNVRATPDSDIYNYGDDNVYPYLFWEGYGMDYIRPDEGFVVKKENVKSFLEEKLSEMNLIKKEYDDFVEFWLPRMQASDFYFITFMPQVDFEKMAPLTVNPKPDTVIRVFMDFEGLDNYTQVTEQKIERKERLGFTVVEWGGALHK